MNIRYFKNAEEKEWIDKLNVKEINESDFAGIMNIFKDILEKKPDFAEEVVKKFERLLEVQWNKLKKKPPEKFEKLLKNLQDPKKIDEEVKNLNPNEEELTRLLGYIFDQFTGLGMIVGIKESWNLRKKINELKERINKDLYDKFLQLYKNLLTKYLNMAVMRERLVEWQQKQQEQVSKARKRENLSEKERDKIKMWSEGLKLTQQLNKKSIEDAKKELKAL